MKLFVSAAILFVAISVIPDARATPVSDCDAGASRTCGKDLTARMARICNGSPARLHPLLPLCDQCDCPKGSIVYDCCCKCCTDEHAKEFC